jgi:hypothetical protein
MRISKLLGFFQGAVLATLAGCGGATDTLGGADAGDDGSATPPATPCHWTIATNEDCIWSFSFTGDAVACAGFTSFGTPAQCLAACGSSKSGQTADTCQAVAADPQNQAHLVCSSNTGACQPHIPPPGNGGRRPGYFASLGFGPPAKGREVGTHFARVACMEAGSVDAFEQLRDELVAHGAPARLVRGASRAIRDEIRHVRMTSALARRFGEAPIAPLPVPARAPRTLAAMALENAVEGCVRETYSALECAWQAESARDPVVRATMKRIARDEMRHLALAWAVHAWALGRLDAADRTRVRAAQRDEIAKLRGELARDPVEGLVRAGGLPRGRQSRALVDAIAAAAA